MRDAESLLDQVLATSDDVIDAALVEDLLGLAQEASVDRFIDALADGDALAGIEVLDTLEAEGRDLVSFADQVVSRLRERLVTALAQDVRADTTRLAAAARRLTGIDASRSGLGGYRWQLELALLGAAAMSPAPQAATGPTREPADPIPAAAVASEMPSHEGSGRPASRAPGARPPTPTVRPPSDAPPGPMRADAHSQPGRDAHSQPGQSAPGEPPMGADLLDDLRRRWPEIVAWIGRNPANRPLVENCRPVEVRDGSVMLGFPEDQPFLREKAEQRRSHLEDGLAHVLGRRVGVRCVVANIELADTQGPTDGDIDLVDQARRVFGGEIADIGEIG